MIISYRDRRSARFASGEFVREFSGFSIRINDQWRICFEWPEGAPGATNVEIVDYH